MASTYFYIKSALTKLDNRKRGKGVRLTAEECDALKYSHELATAFGDYDKWEFDADGELIEDA